MTTCSLLLFRLIYMNKLKRYVYKSNSNGHHQLINRKPYQVRNIIMNSNYCGRIINQYGQYDNMFPSIVSTNIYEQAQAIRLQKQLKRTSSANQLKQNQMSVLWLTNMTIRKAPYKILSRFICEFKGINAQTLEASVLSTCQDFFQNQHLYSKINHTIQQRLKNKRHKS